ncbi:MAG: hypothetical protein ACRDHL_06385, partial [Candidatus Promineifilaceae bacterium]
GDDDPAALRAGYQEMAAAVGPVVRRLAHWPAACQALLEDYAYDQPWRPADGGDWLQRYGADWRSHIANAALAWRNTNLHKYLSLVMNEPA